MAFIQIAQNQGITQAIAEKLNIKGKKYSADVWNQVVGLIEAESKTKNIFDESKGKDIDSKEYHSNYVVQEGIVEISDNTWDRICKLLNVSNNFRKTDVGVQDTDPSVAKTTNLAKAFNLITRGLKNGTLSGTPPEFRNALIQAYGSIDTAGGTPTVAEYVMSLLIDAQKIMNKTDDINQDMIHRAIGGTIELCPDEEMYGKKCSEYSNPKVVEQFMKDNNIQAAPSQQAQIQNISEQKPSEELDNYVKSVANDLISYLESSDIEFNSPDGRKIKGSELAKFLNNIKYDNSWGAARADAQNETVWVSVAAQMPDKTNLTKVLLHEALHCAFNTIQDTQEEERLCETQAIKTISSMINSGKLNDSQVENYGIKYKDITDENLKPIIDSWTNKYYASRPENLSGKVTINGKIIESGDEVYINGQKQGVIGNGNFYIDSPDGRQVYMQNIDNGTTILSDKDNGKGKIEIKHNGVPIYTAYIE